MFRLTCATGQASTVARSVAVTSSGGNWSRTFSYSVGLAAGRGRSRRSTSPTRTGRSSASRRSAWRSSLLERPAARHVARLGRLARGGWCPARPEGASCPHSRRARAAGPPSARIALGSAVGARPPRRRRRNRLRGSAGRVAAGITVAGVSVGGLTAEEAEAKLEPSPTALRRSPSSSPPPSSGTRIRPAALEVEGDWAAAAEEAVDRGDAPFPLRGLSASGCASSAARSTPTADVFQAALDERLDRIAAEVDRPAVEASLVLDGFEPESSPPRPGGSSTARRRRRSWSRRSPASSARRRRCRSSSTRPRSRATPSSPWPGSSAPFSRRPCSLTHQGAVFTIEPQRAGEAARSFRRTAPQRFGSGRRSRRAASRTSPAASPGRRATPTSPSGRTAACASCPRGPDAS